MNLILFSKTELSSASATVSLSASDRRAVHIRKVLKSSVGDTLRVGIIDGKIGTAEIKDVDAGGNILISPTFDKEPPAPWFDILLAMPRPKVMHRLWAELAALGVGRIILTNAVKVEKFYFDNHWLSEDAWRPLLLEGLEQCGATKVPEVMVRRQLKPFVQDELPVLYRDSAKLIAHPHFDKEVKRIKFASGDPRPLVAIGPEGGWTEFELKLFDEAGFVPLSLGDRVLRTDTACVAIAGALRWAYENNI